MSRKAIALSWRSRDVSALRALRHRLGTSGSPTRSRRSGASASREPGIRWPTGVNSRPPTVSTRASCIPCRALTVVSASTRKLPPACSRSVSPGTPVNIASTQPRMNQSAVLVRRLDQSRDPDPPMNVMMSPSWFQDPPGPLAHRTVSFVPLPRNPAAAGRYSEASSGCFFWEAGKWGYRRHGTDWTYDRRRVDL